MQTMGRWAEGQNWYEGVPAERRRVLQPLVDTAANRLRRHASLGELAGAYYEAEAWFEFLVAEFTVGRNEREWLRGAAYWTRLMEIRHPGRRFGARTEHGRA